MKKILLPVVVAINGMLFAQKDLAITLNSPTESQQIEVMEVFQLNFTVTNVGSVALNSLDSVFFIILVNGTEVQMMDPSYTYAERPNDVLNPGESYTIDRSFMFGAMIEGGHDFCVGINLYEGPLQDLTDNVTNPDNTDCNSIEVVGSDLSINNLVNPVVALTYFPNPTTDVLNFETDKIIESISIYTLQGQMIERNNDQNSINLSMINSGQYIYEVKTNEGTVRGITVKL